MEHLTIISHAVEEVKRNNVDGGGTFLKAPIILESKYGTIVPIEVP